MRDAKIRAGGHTSLETKLSQFPSCRTFQSLECALCTVNPQSITDSEGFSEVP